MSVCVCSVDSYCSDGTVHYKSNETVNFCGFNCATTSPITVCYELCFYIDILTVIIVTRRSKTANITKDDITLQHIATMSLCCEVISSFLIFAVVDLRVCRCRP